MKLTELTDRWACIESMLDQNGGELTPEIEALIAEFSLDEADKVDAYIHVIEDLRGRAKLAVEQAQALQQRALARRNRADWLERRLRDHMTARGLEKLEGGARYARLQTNGGRAPLEGEGILDPSLLPARFQQFKIEPRAEELRQALEAGAVITDDMGRQIVALGERGKHVRLY